MNTNKVGWQKILAVILGLAVLVGLSYLVLWLKPDTESGGVEPMPMAQNGISTIGEDISGWKTYRNEKYGVELQYPKTWFFYDQTDNILLSDRELPGGTDALHLDIEFKNKSVEDVVQSMQGYASCLPTTFNGYSGFNCGFNNVGLGSDSVVLLSRGMSSILISDGLATKVSTQILSTFKFIESEVDTSGWKVYRNEEYGFEFKYPLEWMLGETYGQRIVSIEENPGWGGASAGIFIFLIKVESVDEVFENAKEEKTIKDKISPEVPRGYPRYGDPEIVYVDGIKAVKRYYKTYEIVPSGIEYIIPEKGLDIFLTDVSGVGMDPAAYSAKNRQIRQGVISSFKFF